MAQGSLSNILLSLGNIWYNDCNGSHYKRDKPALLNSSCVIATLIGLYIQELFPDLCSCAFILELVHKGAFLRLMLLCLHPDGSFPDHSKDACAYRGELLGLMAIHLILLAANMVEPRLAGSVNAPAYASPVRCSALRYHQEYSSSELQQPLLWSRISLWKSPSRQPPELSAALMCCPTQLLHGRRGQEHAVGLSGRRRCPTIRLLARAGVSVCGSR